MRIIQNYAHIWNIKSRLNITIDETLLSGAKRYADKNHTSLSQLVEDYFKKILRPGHKKNIIDLVESLPKPKMNTDVNLKEAYYENKKAKYGF